MFNVDSVDVYHRTESASMHVHINFTHYMYVYTNSSARNRRNRQNCSVTMIFHCCLKYGCLSSHRAKWTESRHARCKYLNSPTGLSCSFKFATLISIALTYDDGSKINRQTHVCLAYLIQIWVSHNIHPPHFRNGNSSWFSFSHLSRQNERCCQRMGRALSDKPVMLF